MFFKNPCGYENHGKSHGKRNRSLYLISKNEYFDKRRVDSGGESHKNQACCPIFKKLQKNRCGHEIMEKCEKINKKNLSKQRGKQTYMNLWKNKINMVGLRYIPNFGRFDTIWKMWLNL